MPKMHGRQRRNNQTKHKVKSADPRIAGRQQLRDLGPFSAERHLLNRQWIMDRIRAEVIGPDPNKNALPEISQDGVYDIASKDALYNIGKQNNGEEVLINDPPLKRYGAGILFPKESQLGEELLNTSPVQEDDTTNESDQDSQDSATSKDGLKNIQKIGSYHIPDFSRNSLGYFLSFFR